MGQQKGRMARKQPCGRTEFNFFPTRRRAPVRERAQFRQVPWRPSACRRCREEIAWSFLNQQTGPNRTFPPAGPLWKWKSRRNHTRIPVRPGLPDRMAGLQGHNTTSRRANLPHRQCLRKRPRRDVLQDKWLHRATRNPLEPAIVRRSASSNNSEPPPRVNGGFLRLPASAECPRRE